MSSFLEAKTINIYSGYLTLEETFHLEKTIFYQDQNYESKAKRILLIKIGDFFVGKIKSIKFPKPMKGEFIYAIVEMKEEDKFRISLGV